MRYRKSHGKVVRVNVDKDLDGKVINTDIEHVITFYFDSDVEVVGIYPLEEDSYTKEEMLSFQPVKHEVYIRDLEEIKR